MARVDLDAADQESPRLAAHAPGSTPGQMAEALKGEYGEHAEIMAIVLRSIMACSTELLQHAQAVPCRRHRYDKRDYT